MKLFTVAEANALLPAVREILKKIQDARKKLASYRSQAKVAADQAEQGGGGFGDGLRYADLLIELTSQTSELEASRSAVERLRARPGGFPFFTRWARRSALLANR